MPRQQDWLRRALRNEPFWPRAGTNEDSVEHLLRAAENHGVSGLLFDKARHSPEWERLPETLRQRLHRSAKRAAAREGFLQEETSRDLGALASRRIEGLLLKGTALAYTLYPEPELRPRADVDLLVRDKETAEEAWNLLRELGYERGASISGDPVSHQYTCVRRVTPLAGLAFDVHWKLSNSNFFAQKFSFRVRSQS